jgi:hypothetical protein
MRVQCGDSRTLSAIDRVGCEHRCECARYAVEIVGTAMTWPEIAYLAGMIIPAGVATGALSWMMIKLTRSPFNRGLWLLTGCIAAGAAQYLFAWLHQVSHDGLIKLGQNLAMVVFQFLMVCFFFFIPPTVRIASAAKAGSAEQL